MLETGWWLAFWTAVGLCAGSFLNVVIFRLPRNQSLRAPLWSACTQCDNRIRWYDNLPIVSYLLLRGRCRSCHTVISPRYLLIEATMAVIVLLLLDAFCIGQTRAGLSHSVVGLTDRLASDWPILLAHVILFACLLSMSAIDLEHYWVDIRFTNFATVAGFALHTFWTPRHSMAWTRPFDTTAVVCLFAVAGLCLTALALICQPNVDPEDFEEDEEELGDMTPGEQQSKPVESRGIGAFALVLTLPLLLLLAALLSDLAGHPVASHTTRAWPMLLLLLALIVWESTRKRESDHEIVEAIESERHGARSMVATELVLLLPAVALGIAGAWLMSGDGDLASRISQTLAGRGMFWADPLARSWNPLSGLATAASGYIIAGALGWIIRIGFTLVLGKEAFGTGDIHMMAAAGCVAGWPVVVLGFFVAVVLALVGWIIVLPVKRSRAIPLGPWLSIAFLIVVIFYDTMIRWPFIDRAIKACRLLFLQNSQ